MADVTAQLVDASGDFLVALRSNEGFQQDLYDRLVGVLRDCAREWREADVVSKLAADVLVSIVPASWAAAESYAEPERQRIMAASFALYELVGECVYADHQFGS
ncbi:hypothetical protein [Kibdelosporangium phytohabitans]|nr:hypothetical protein [Kibdelosporangium phytohabitans]MBE1470724.1 hypothetical protein [Kibdelosporangium phytohabitans]